eukprot:symbB.v1.2.005876.t3/scaffold345.1/size224439/1
MRSSIQSWRWSQIPDCSNDGNCRAASGAVGAAPVTGGHVAAVGVDSLDAYLQQREKVSDVPRAPPGPPGPPDRGTQVRHHVLAHDRRRPREDGSSVAPARPLAPMEPRGPTATSGAASHAGSHASHAYAALQLPSRQLQFGDLRVGPKNRGFDVLCTQPWKLRILKKRRWSFFLWPWLQSPLRSRSKMHSCVKTRNLLNQRSSELNVSNVLALLVLSLHWQLLGCLH